MYQLWVYPSNQWKAKPFELGHFRHFRYFITHFKFANAARKSTSAESGESARSDETEYIVGLSDATGFSHRHLDSVARN